MKNWKVKEEGGLSLFGEKPKYYNTKEEAMQEIKKTLPQCGILSQAVHAKLFERNGLFRWKLHGCYIHDTRYYTEDGNDLAEPLKDIVSACEHVKKHLDMLEKEGKTKCNAMFGIRASWIHTFCKKNCKIGRSMFT